MWSGCELLPLVCGRDSGARLTGGVCVVGRLSTGLLVEVLEGCEELLFLGGWLFGGWLFWGALFCGAGLELDLEGWLFDGWLLAGGLFLGAGLELDLLGWLFLGAGLLDLVGWLLAGSLFLPVLFLLEEAWLARTVWSGLESTGESIPMKRARAMGSSVVDMVSPK
jgi:hypothetical protein